MWHVAAASRAIVLLLLLAGGPAAAQTTCAAELDRWQAVLANDLKTGHVAQRVHDAALADIARIRPVCAAGHEAQANRQIASAKAKYGYR
jgi:hypothetical protein